MKQVKNDFVSEREKENYVADCEREFEQSLDAVSAQAAARKGLRVITVSGPTCACKSTVVKKIIADMIDVGKKVKIIAIDDFFRSRTEDRDQALARGEPIDFDSIDALDFPYFKECLSSMLASKPTMLPCFDFMSGKRSGYTEYRPDGEIIVLEGIQAVYPEITALLAHTECLSIYLDVEGPVRIGGEVFSGREVRLCRRIVRDARFRNAKPEFTMFLWDSVAENEERNMIPYADGADIRVDTFLACELGILREPLTALLSCVPIDDAHYGQAHALIHKFASVTPIDAAYLSADSMYKEFLG